MVALLAVTACFAGAHTTCPYHERPPACFATARAGCRDRARPPLRLVASAAPAESIQYSWSKSGYVTLRKDLRIDRSGQFEAAYNGQRGCTAKGALSENANAALWNEADALIRGDSRKTVPAFPQPLHTSAPRAAMDNGPAAEMLTITIGDRSWIYSNSSPAARHMLDQLRPLLPPCAF